MRASMGTARKRRTARNGCPTLMAAAAATAAASAATGGGGGFGGNSIAGAVCGGEDGKLDARLLAGALGTSDFLLLVDDNLLKARFAFIAQVFVDGHRGSPLLLGSILGAIIAGVWVLCAGVGPRVPP